MDAFKKFFEKKKADAKFKLAGQGRSLSRDAAQQPRSSHSGYGMPQPRATPTQGARQAGAAALARIENSSKNTEVDWSMKAIKSQARREMEAERTAMEQMKLNEQLQVGPREVHLEGAPMLAVRGVYFHCPLIGPEVASYDEIKKQIRDFLYSQIEEDRAISSCIIIHTCNKNKEKIKLCIETLCKYIENIVSNPTEEKFRKIRISNKAYQERIDPIEGTKEFLEAAGFTMQELPFNDTTDTFWVFPEENLDDLNALEQLRDALVSAEPIRPQLDRSMSVLLPAEAATHMELPSEFFNMTADELKKEMQTRADAVERSQVMMTKAMRERMEMREMRKYRFSLIRVRFPDSLILQGTFNVHEKFEEVLKFVRENLVNDWRPFFLTISGGGKVTEGDQNLVELRLVPAIVFNFEWDPDVQDPNLDDNVYLKPETLMLLQEKA
ncbi:UBX domain-containing protein 6-like [Eriocheir sinensis]|uniref:UBX domain-containing protein 6-like n=1 Tax=Eriocheir sinensis TaxID=95602 RepID=UPI0021C8486F|nr:UBX domain-containing protein 6-like [Eriocheir sinensis]XP_050735791.1 UBX domain-containing protein 6-like [Eriocheir sinensis]XP_050735792.1 UBX domain-containing protein 6-like [Eriocheir sinensis]XP_050735794.1 UBX domain-containing protein 6-like [Eriocheir sinensis]XP_050735795.1 UBX domain-containing protein 6-like [Eriocheir sinensis]XP_050735796.1 UBX domain-containing protein 6-like [Eriocheir sinensis]XP_050735797.1 UBX domain-containing protein 6-like [Eriocheir sinensis]XP_0